MDYETKTFKVNNQTVTVHLSDYEEAYKKTEKFFNELNLSYLEEEFNEMLICYISTELASKILSE